MLLLLLLLVVVVLALLATRHAPGHGPGHNHGQPQTNLAVATLATAGRWYGRRPGTE